MWASFVLSDGTLVIGQLSALLIDSSVRVSVSQLKHPTLFFYASIDCSSHEAKTSSTRIYRD